MHEEEAAALLAHSASEDESASEPTSDTEPPAGTCTSTSEHSGLPLHCGEHQAQAGLHAIILGQSTQFPMPELICLSEQGDIQSARCLIPLLRAVSPSTGS